MRSSSGRIEDDESSSDGDPRERINESEIDGIYNEDVDASASFDLELLDRMNFITKQAAAAAATSSSIRVVSLSDRRQNLLLHQ